MCTPSFMCKFPFSGRVGLPRANWWPTLGRTRLWRAAPAVGRAYAKSTPPPQHRYRALAPRDRLPAGGHPRGDAGGRARERARTTVGLSGRLAPLSRDLAANARSTTAARLTNEGALVLRSAFAGGGAGGRRRLDRAGAGTGREPAGAGGSGRGR